MPVLQSRTELAGRPWVRSLPPGVVLLGLGTVSSPQLLFAILAPGSGDTRGDLVTACNGCQTINSSSELVEIVVVATTVDGLGVADS